jgi:hypothetical protein
VQVQRLADEVVRGPDLCAHARQVSQKAPKGRPVGQQEGIVEKPEVPAAPHRVGPRSLVQRDQRLIARCRTHDRRGQPALECPQAQDLLIVLDRASQVGHLKAHPAHARGGG